MLIVHGQIHLWEKGTPSPPHRQEPYSAEQAIAAMDQAGVDRALIHPVLWDPDSNELAVEAVRKYPNRFAIMGWFYLDEAEPDEPAEQQVELQPLHQLPLPSAPSRTPATGCPQ
jgi:predicted TIM-barrel fold metal-dependent hydrolase